MFLPKPPLISSNYICDQDDNLYEDYHDNAAANNDEKLLHQIVFCSYILPLSLLFSFEQKSNQNIVNNILPGKKSDAFNVVNSIGERKFDCEATLKKGKIKFSTDCKTTNVFFFHVLYYFSVFEESGN